MTVAIQDSGACHHRILSLFQERFGTGATVFRAPGRINLIGDHTDYNDGFVLPMAIKASTWVAIAKRQDRALKAYSENFGESVTLPLDALAGGPRNHWSDFIRGVACTLHQAGHQLVGANLLICGEVPLGAGLSSSASLEVAVALALASAGGVFVPTLELVKLCQAAEHQYVGTRCGIMDQFVTCFGRSGHALMLDCRTLEHEVLPIPSDVQIVVCNSMVRRELATGEYNLRRAECESGVESLRSFLPRIRVLRDVQIADLERHRNVLSATIYRRCRHVVTENQRVLDAAKALQSNDCVQVGHLMCESHASLRDDYSVSCSELDLLVTLASSLTGVYGARMMGGGFGGCTVNLLRSESVAAFCTDIRRMYAEKTGITPGTYICEPAQGASAWPPQGGSQS
jgi:galactokinase